MQLLSCLAFLSFFTDAYGAAIQFPLPVNNYGEPMGLSPALEKLNQTLRGRLRELNPMSKPCYSVDGHSVSLENQIECKELQDHRTSDVFVTNQPAGYYFSNWATCQTTGEACSMPVTNSSYISPISRCHQGNVPDYYVDIERKEDVKVIFKAAKEIKRNIVIKNTGHDWKGRSAGHNSIALWTHNLRNEKRVPIKLIKDFVPEKCNGQGETVFTCGAGETWRGIYEFAEKNDLAAVGGTCGTVGVAGWLHGGGHSPLTPTFGMGVDNVRQLKLVLPTGEEVVANNCQNEDIFNAVKGGGGGTWGVIMEISYKALPKFKVQEFSISLPGLDVDATYRLFDILTKYSILWSNQGWGGYINTNRANRTVTLINPRITLAEAAEDMTALINFGQQTDAEVVLKTHDSWYAYYREYFMDPSYHIGAWGTTIASRLISSEVLQNDTLRHEMTKALVELHYSTVNFIIMPVTPTRFNGTTGSSLHPSWRTATWLIRINDRWDPFSQAATPSTNHQKFEKVHRAMDPIRALTPDMGVSVSEADSWEENYEEHFWGRENHEKLLKVKNRVDPDGILSVWQGIRFDKKDDRFKCYPQP